MVKERVKSMIINGVYGNSSPAVQDTGVSPVPKEGLESTAAKSNITIETIPAPADTDYITYDENAIQKQQADSQQKEDISEEEEPDNTSERMSEEDYKAISEEGISLKEYNMERLARALQRIKTQRSVKEESIISQKENLDKKLEAVENMANYGTAAKKIVEKLIESGLPVTEANIARIATAMEMASAALNISDKSMNYLIKNNLEPTIENIYKAQYSGSYSQKQEITDQVYESLKGQVNEIIDNAGLEVNEENIRSARWLINHQLPLSENTLWSYRDLKQLQNNNNEITILDKAVEAFVSGKAPEAASLGNAAAEQARNYITAFGAISDEAIKAAVKNNENGQANYRELRNAQRQSVQQDLSTDREQFKAAEADGSEEFEAEAGSIDIKTITVRRQLEEIRLKLTLDSGQQLIRQGFKLDTDSLSKIVDGLKEVEDRYYKNLLKEGNAAVDADNVQVLKDSLKGVEDLKAMPSYILGSTLSNRNIESVNGLLSAGTECRNTLDKAGEAYEALMTKPRSDMGDSIAKAFRNVDSILEDMKLETTQANERAVRILGYNGIAITEENIQYVKSYDEQVNRLMKNFHPAVAAELIKEGTNPLDIPIEELNQQIAELQSELGITDEEKYSKYLWKLEKNKSITDEEKKSFIGIYRLLNTVEKTDGAALGAVLKADQEVTMSNLLTAVRTMKNGGVDAAVDDSFGSLTQLTYTGESITEQVNASFNSNPTSDKSEAIPDNLKEKFSYSNQLLKDVMEEITPDKLQGLGNTEDILNMSVEKLKEELLGTAENGETEKDYWSEKLREYHDITGQSENAVDLLKNYDIPANLPNIQAAKDLLSKDQSFYKQLNKVLKLSETKEPDGESTDPPEVELSNMSEGFMEAMTNKSSMMAQYQEVEQDVNKLLGQMYASPVITSQDIATLQRISYGMSFIQKLAARESYEIPLAVGDNITNVNVTILRNTGETGKVNINMDSDTLGKVSVSLSVKEQGVKALITCDNRPGLDAIRNNSQKLMSAVTRSGTEIQQLNYGIGNITAETNRYTNYDPVKESQNNNPDKADVSTDALYKLAKTFLVHIKETENNLE